MSKKQSKSDWVDASLALALAAGGGLLVLLSLLTLKSGGLPSGDGALPVLARAMIGNFGLIPGLLAGLVMALTGSWMFLANRYEGVVRHLAGALCTVAGLAVLLGALSEDAGGRLGAALGGTASEYLTKPGGAVFGLIVLLAPVWLFWFKDRLELASVLKSAPRSGADADAHDAGVSVAEAEALAPVMPAPISAGQAAPELSNPYPEDVRLKGALPAGTLPLDADGHVQIATPPDDDHAEHADSLYDSSVHRWTPQRDEPADEPADDDLAVAVDEYDGDELGEVRLLDSGADAGDPFAEHSYRPEAEGLVESEPAVEALTAAPNASGATRLTDAYQPPRPSWEVDDDEEQVEESVPLEVTEALELEDESLEEASTEVKASYYDDEDEEESYGEDDLDDERYSDDDDEDEDDDEDDEEEDEDDVYEEEDDYDESYDETYAEDDSEEEEEYEEEEEPEEELEETYAEDDSEEEEEYEEEEEPEEELEETYAEDDSEEEEEYEEEEEPEEELEETYAEDDSEEEEEYEEEEEPEEELEETYAEDDSEEEEECEEEEEPEEELEETYASDQDDADDVEEPAAEAEPEEQPVAQGVPGEFQMDLFDEPPAAARPAARVAVDAGDTEPEVVLAPQAAAGDGARKISAQLLTDAGNLFLSENRVAVSMLQKRFALDFDQSCVILDELQELGLIGPYVDGTQRDILMSSEEWLELTGQS
ncbi:MAG: hypothetical protein H6831_01730 [Planctomycetes bacterium]|nr:hypothetical protein [Planctomycetota bacterium]